MKTKHIMIGVLLVLSFAGFVPPDTVLKLIPALMANDPVTSRAPDVLVPAAREDIERPLAMPRHKPRPRPWQYAMSPEVGHGYSRA